MPQVAFPQRTIGLFALLRVAMGCRHRARRPGGRVSSLIGPIHNAFYLAGPRPFTIQISWNRRVLSGARIAAHRGSSRSDLDCSRLRSVSYAASSDFAAFALLMLGYALRAQRLYSWVQQSHPTVSVKLCGRLQSRHVCLT
jgi:hypothetical protein